MSNAKTYSPSSFERDNSNPKFKSPWYSHLISMPEIW
jgi:hypothetical protein